MLKGTEVKSLRQGKANIDDAYARFRDGEIFLYNAHISPYSHAAVDSHEPAPAPQAAAAPLGTEAPPGQGPGTGLYPDPPETLFQGRTRQGGNRPGQGQKEGR